MRKKQILHQRARRLRRDQTGPETTLWRLLRGRQFASFKFRRQFPVHGFVADFCCPEKKLVIELDGDQHADPGDREYDRQRTATLQQWGYRVIRFWNTEIVENLDGVMEEIFKNLS